MLYQKSASATLTFMSTFSLSLPGAGVHLDPQQRRSIADAARRGIADSGASPFEVLAARVASEALTIEIARETDAHGATRIVETIGVAVRVVASDVRARGLGVDAVAFTTSTSPNSDHLDGVVATRSWAPVPTVDPPAPGLYPNDAPYVPRVFQALSSAASEARAVIDMVEAWHLPLSLFFQPGAVATSTPVTRTQLELTAARVSVLNECFYCTIAHSSMLAAAGEAESCAVDLAALSATRGGGVPGGDAIVAFVDAVIADDGIDDARAELVDRLGQKEMKQIASTIGVFAGLNRLADAFRIPFDLGEDAARDQAALVPGSINFPGANSNEV